MMHGVQDQESPAPLPQAFPCGVEPSQSLPGLRVEPHCWFPHSCVYAGSISSGDHAYLSPHLGVCFWGIQPKTHMGMITSGLSL